MILRGLLNVCEIDFVVRAPDGKEVEELTRKDIIKALRTKVPIEQVLPRLNRSNNEHRFNNFRNPDMPQQGQHGQPQRQPMPEQRQQEQRAPSQPSQRNDRPMERQPVQRQAEPDRNSQILSPTEISRKLLSRERDTRPQLKPLVVEDDPALGIKDIRGNAPEGLDTIPMLKNRGGGAPEPDQNYINSLDELHNTLRGRLYGSDGRLVSEIPIRELIETVQDAEGISTIVFDGIITQRLIELAKKRGVSAIYGIRGGQVSRTFDDMLLYTKESGKL